MNPGIATERLLPILQARLPQMVEALGSLVTAESPSKDLVATAACAEVAEGIAFDLLGSRAERIMSEGRVHLRWRFGDPRVVLIGHLDTVWPVGTTARWPFEVDGDIASGPGSFDMKAGIVQLLHSVSLLDDLRGVTILLTTDEELGSPTSRPSIEEAATGARAALIFEPSAGGALKTERKGYAGYKVKVKGVSAHAGLEPEAGVNATIELAHQVLAIAALEKPEIGTTVSPTILKAGSSSNSIPDAGGLYVDVRAATRAEQERVDRAMRSLQPRLEGSEIEVTGSIRPPMPRSACEELFARAVRLADDLGLPPLGEVGVGGGSDGNLTAALAVPTLDGLGAVGDGAHARGEHVSISAMAERAALVSALLRELLAE